MRDAAIDPHRQSSRGTTRARAAGAPPLDGLLGDDRAPRAAQPVARKGVMTSAAVAAQRLGGGRGNAALAGGRRRAAPGLVAGLRSRLPRIRPFKLLTTSIFSVALVGIVANAMVFQRGRHPAPLFGVGQPGESQGEATPQATAAATVAAPLERTGSVAPVASPAPVAVPAPALPAPKPVQARRIAAKPHQEDGIGNLLGHATPAVAAHPRPGHTAKPATPDGKAAAHGEAKPRTTALPAGQDHRAASEAAAILAHPAGSHPAKGEAPAKAHPRPHAAKPDSVPHPAAKLTAAGQKSTKVE